MAGYASLEWQYSDSTNTQSAGAEAPKSASFNPFALPPNIVKLLMRQPLNNLQTP